MSVVMPALGPAERAAAQPAAVASPSRVSLLIPARNEARNIGWVLRQVPSSVDEIVLIDGRSTDRTIEVARAIRPDVEVVTELGQGKGAAIRAGIATATGSVAVMIDADGSMDPREIDRYLEAIADGADLVKGSRFLPGGGTSDMTRVRRIGNAALRTTVNALYRTRHSELCYGYMAFRLDAIRSLGLAADGFEIETEIVVRALLAGLTVTEVPSFENPRRSGSSNLNAVRDGLRIVDTIVRHRLAARVRPVREGTPLAGAGSTMEPPMRLALVRPRAVLAEAESDDEIEARAG